MTTKTIKILLLLPKWILALLLFLFSLATLMGHSYLQTFLLWLAVAILFYWPSSVESRWNKRTSSILRWASVILLLLVSFLAFKPEPKESIYLSDISREELMRIYDNHTQDWPAGTENIYLETSYGRVLGIDQVD